VIAYPDTSFLCALYVPQSTSAAALAHYRRMREPLHVAALLLYEFRQSVRFQIFRHSRDASQGYRSKAGLGALAKLKSNLESGALAVTPVDWADVFNRAEELSARHTPAGGHRAIDVLHVATALHLGAGEFLSFDANQRRLAALAGLTVKP
jgi:predicted nucleic acid-binding protein